MNKKITVFYDHILNAARQQGVTTAEIIKQLLPCGISGVEMDYYMLKESGDGLAEELSRLGLPINCCYCFFDWANNPTDDSYMDVLLDLDRLGIKNLLVVPGFVNRNILSIDDPDGILSDESADILEIALKRAREAMLPNMIHLLDYAKELGIHVAMEDFDDNIAPFSTMSQLKWFFDRLPSLGCAFDTGNFLYSEEDVLTAYELLRKRITYVHCKDRSFTPVPGEDSKLTVKGRPMYSASVGKGVIPMMTILELLEHDEYEGTIAIEHFGSLDQLRDMKASAAFLNYYA